MVEDHLICHGFVHGDTEWVFHGEGFSSRNTPHPTNEIETSNMHDDIDRLLHDTFRIVVDDQRHEGMREGPPEDAKRFFKLVEKGKEELYPECKNFSKLSFTIWLYLFKCIHKLDDVAFSDLLDLIRESIPFSQIPDSFYKAKKVIKELGLNYEKIHACTYDCMLFWNDNAKLDNCSVCGASRWKSVRNDLNNNVTKIPVKVLRYFTLKPRLQRIFTCCETSVAMRWHDTERLRDGNLRHPADGEDRKDFDSLRPDFANDACNVRLGPLSPINDINVYLQPLIAELKKLLEVEVETYDAVTTQIFLKRAVLLWTISDFPALAMLSGWSTKGKLVAARKVLPKNIAMVLIRLDEIKLGGPTHLRWMYSTERTMCDFKGFVRNRKNPEGSTVEGISAVDCLKFISVYLPNTVKTKLSMCETEDDENIQTEESGVLPLFPKTGHPIGSENTRKGKIINIEQHELFEAHRYILFNTGNEQVEAFIKEHNNLTDNLTRGNAWVKSHVHSREFGDWCRDKVTNIEVSNHLKWLDKGSNFVEKRYTGYFINGYRFHTKTRDAPCKTQNSGVTLSATTDSFASARDQNPIDGMHLKCIKFFYVEDPVEKNVYYARNKVPVDLYDLEEKNCPNIEETFWREPNEDICPSERVLDVDVRWSREDLPVDIIDAPSLAQHSQDEAMETSEEEEDDFDDTDWDWMEHMQMNSVTPQTNDQPEEQELSSLLGTLARNATICLFDILDWRNMDTKKNLWDYTKEKYIIPEAAYNWTMVTIRDAWRRHRSDLKMK
ncbi:uncharacterized protein [Solanum lycopersicum]|uniref:uncharacterized protein n=1 Tax=Solanum lycopersicum TaxID=4081 RepID=UPI003747A6FD